MKLLFCALICCIIIITAYKYKNSISWYMLKLLTRPYTPLTTQQLPTTVFNSNVPSTEKPITVIIPSYNNAQWAVRNLDSMLMQQYSNYRIIYINDVSTDDTAEIIKKYMHAHGVEHKITFIDNQTKKGALANIYDAVHSCAPHEIILTLDGDDWLSHEHVLNVINNAYTYSRTWLTYGQYEDYPLKRHGICEQIPETIIKNNAYRSYKWVSSHPRTFYAWLFKKIKKEDLCDKNNNFFATSWDLAFMLPMLEMAGTHATFINEILYIYNITNPLNDYRVRGQEQNNTAQHIRAQKKYLPISAAMAQQYMAVARAPNCTQESTQNREHTPSR